MAVRKQKVVVDADYSYGQAAEVLHDLTEVARKHDSVEGLAAAAAGWLELARTLDHCEDEQEEQNPIGFAGADVHG